MKRSAEFAFIGAALLLTACAAPPARSITRGDLLADYSFADATTFEQGAYDAAVLRITDGVYRIDVRQGDNTLWWGQWGATYDDVMIEVDAAQITERNENAYGVMCRVSGTVGQPQPPDPDLVAILNATPEATPDAEATAELTPEATPDAEATAELTPEATPDAEATAELTPEATADAVRANTGDGYLFLVQGTGSYAIMRARGRAVTPLVNWTASDVIERGPATHRLRAICAGDYLALYVNDQLLAATTDSTYRSGQVGLAASAANPLGVRVEFDNLMVYRAEG